MLPGTYTASAAVTPTQVVLAFRYRVKDKSGSTNSPLITTPQVILTF